MNKVVIVLLFLILALTPFKGHSQAFEFSDLKISFNQVPNFGKKQTYLLIHILSPTNRFVRLSLTDINSQKVYYRKLKLKEGKRFDIMLITRSYSPFYTFEIKYSGKTVSNKIDIENPTLPSIDLLKITLPDVTQNIVK